MLQYFETLQDENGNALPGATATVFTYPGGAPATLYSSNSTANPNTQGIVTADATGQISFFIQDGAYTINYAVAGTVYKTKSPVQMTDPMGQVLATDTGAPNAYVVTNSAYPLSLYTGLKVQLKIGAANGNTGPCTFNLNATGAQSLTGTGGIALAAGTIPGNAIIYVQWDGTEWQMLATVSQPFYATTQAEITAGVTVVNPNYPPLTVDRYITNTTPGTTACQAGFNAAIAVAQVAGGQILYGQTGPYLCTAPINGTFTGGANQQGWILKNIGNYGSDTPFPSGTQLLSIIAKHTGVAALDLTGSKSVLLDGVTICTDTATYPQVGVLTARNATGESNFFAARNSRIIGLFSIAPYYNYGSEDDSLINCSFINRATTANTKTRVYTANNSFALTSPFTTIFSGLVSCIDHNAKDCIDQNSAGTSTSDCVYLESSDSFKNYGGWMYSGNGSANGRALVYVDMSYPVTGGPSNYGVLHGVTAENSTFMQNYGVLFSNQAFTPTGWDIDSCKLFAQTNAIAAVGTSPTLDNAHIRNIAYNGGATGLNWPGTIQNSVLETVDMPLTIGVSSKNSLSGDTNAFTITTRSKDSWTEMGTVNRAWTPVLGGAFTTVGAVTKRGICNYIGGSFTFSMLMQAATSIAWTANAAITGLPAAPVDQVCFPIYDLTAGTVIGTATMSSGTLTLVAAQTTSAHEFLIGGTFPCS